MKEKLNIEKKRRNEQYIEIEATTSTTVWGWARIKLTTHGSAVELTTDWYEKVKILSVCTQHCYGPHNITIYVDHLWFIKFYTWHYTTTRHSHVIQIFIQLIIFGKRNTHTIKKVFLES